MMTARGAATGGLGGLARGMGGRLMSLAPMLATPAALLGAQQLVSRVTRQAQDTIREGQVTGGGFSEGLAARRESLQLAANPFDMLDRRSAQEIVKGIRSRGFTGELGRALQDTVGDVFQDLGTDIETNIEMLTTVVRENIMTVSEFRDTMRDLDKQAKATGLSVKSVQEELKGAMDLAAGVGGAPAAKAAALNAPALTGIFANLVGIAGPQATSQALGATLQRGAQMFGGVPAFLSGSAAVQADAGKYFDQIANFLYDQMKKLPEPYNTVNGLAMYLAGPGQGLGLTGGLTDVAQIEAFLKALFKARATGGVQKQIAAKRAEASKSAADAKLKAEKTMQVGSGYSTSAISGALSLFNSARNKLGFGGTSQDSMKQALQKLRTDMETVGVDPARINEILGKPRRAAFAEGLPTNTRTDMWNPAWAEATREAVQEIKVTLAPTPEFSRYAQAQNTSRTAYIAGGKNSQYTMPLPPVRGG